MAPSLSHSRCRTVGVLPRTLLSYMYSIAKPYYRPFKIVFDTKNTQSANMNSMRICCMHNYYGDGDVI